jgi:hypothetical protein
MSMLFLLFCKSITSAHFLLTVIKLLLSFSFISCYSAATKVMKGFCFCKKSLLFVGSARLTVPEHLKSLLHWRVLHNPVLSPDFAATRKREGGLSALLSAWSRSSTISIWFSAVARIDEVIYGTFFR